MQQVVELVLREAGDDAGDDVGDLRWLAVGQHASNPEDRPFTGFQREVLGTRIDVGRDRFGAAALAAAERCSVVTPTALNLVAQMIWPAILAPAIWVIAAPSVEA